MFCSCTTRYVSSRGEQVQVRLWVGHSGRRAIASVRKFDSLKQVNFTTARPHPASSPVTSIACRCSNPATHTFMHLPPRQVHITLIRTHIFVANISLLIPMRFLASTRHQIAKTTQKNRLIKISTPFINPFPPSAPPITAITPVSSPLSVQNQYVPHSSL